MQLEYGYFEETHLGKPYDVKLLKRLYPFIRSHKLLVLWSVITSYSIHYTKLYEKNQYYAKTFRLQEIEERINAS